MKSLREYKPFDYWVFVVIMIVVGDSVKFQDLSKKSFPCKVSALFSSSENLSGVL